MSVINELKIRPILPENQHHHQFDYLHSFNPAHLDNLSKATIHCIQTGLIELLEFSIKNPFYENSNILLFPIELDGFIPKTWKVRLAYYDYSSHLKPDTKKYLLLHADLNPLAVESINQKISKIKERINQYEKIYICLTEKHSYSHWHTISQEINKYEIIASITKNIKDYEFITYTDIKQNFSFTTFDFFDLDETTLFRSHHELIFNILSKGGTLIKETDLTNSISHAISIYHSINFYPDNAKRFDLNELIFIDKTIKSSKSKLQTYLYSYCLDLINNR